MNRISARGSLLPATVCAFSLLLFVMVLGHQASADPIVYPPPAMDTTFRLSDPISGIAWLFFVNALVNLLSYAGLLLAFAKKYIPISGIIKTSGLRFMFALVGAVFVISLIGAVVDFYFVTQPRTTIYYDHNLDQHLYKTYRVVFFNLANWIVALSLVALSIVACSLALVRLRAPLSLMIAAGFVIINLVFWILVAELGEDFTFLTIVFGALAAPVVVRSLLLWYTGDRLVQAKS